MTPPSLQPRTRRPVLPWAVVALLVAYWLLAISASPRMGVTADEILHDHGHEGTAGYHPHESPIVMLIPLLPTGAGGTSAFDVGTFDNMVFDGFGSSQDTILQIFAFNALVKMGGYL